MPASTCGKSGPVLFPPVDGRYFKKNWLGLFAICQFFVILLYQRVLPLVIMLDKFLSVHSLLPYNNANIENLTQTMEKIDNLDRKILSIIMKNARIPSKDVAHVCGVSRAAVHQRIQRLIDMKVITGSGYNVNPKSLGYTTCTYIGVSLERGAMYREVIPELEKIPEIVECHYTTGTWGIIVKLYARDNEHLMDLLNNKIQMIPGIVNTETFISLDNAIHRVLPIGLYIDNEPEEE